MEVSVISLSHWGMFEYRPWVFFVPAGYRLADDLQDDWAKPGGIIEIVRI